MKWTFRVALPIGCQYLTAHDVHSAIATVWRATDSRPTHFEVIYANQVYEREADFDDSAERRALESWIYLVAMKAVP